MSDSLVAAVDLGGTSIKGSLYDRHGHTVAELCVPTPAGDPRATVDAVRATTRGLVDRRGDADVVAAGVVVPGVVDRITGVASYAANIGWTDVPLRDVLESDLGIPVAVDHDVHAAGEAERALGAATACDDVVVVVIGTGIAAVSYSEGRMVRGATRQAGEIGHIAVVPDGELCACRARGCLEVYASAAAIARRYVQRTGRPAFTAAQIVARHVTDADAAAVWADATRCLGDALAAMTLLIDPELIVLAGGLSEAGEVLLVPVRERIQTALTWRPAPRVVASPLGARAGRVGAAVIAWRRAGLADDLAWDPRVQVGS